MEREQAAPASAQGAAVTARLPVVDLWSRPAEDADRVSQALLGTILTPIDVSGAYLYVEAPDAYRGWVRRADTAPLPASDGERWFVGAPRCPFTAQPESATPDGELYFGTELTVLEQRGDRCRVCLPEGQAWVPAAALRRPHPAALPPDLDLLRADARQFLGVRYLWGGGTVHGIDCSGFVQLLYRAQGRILRRDAHLQLRHGKAVAAAALQPGDLLFFGRCRRGLPTHVGLYLGEGEYIHAHGGDAQCVEISPFAEALPRFWGARRIA